MVWNRLMYHFEYSTIAFHQIGVQGNGPAFGGFGLALPHRNRARIGPPASPNGRNTVGALPVSICVHPDHALNGAAAGSAESDVAMFIPT